LSGVITPCCSSCGTSAARADGLASRAIVRIFPRYRGSIDWRGSDVNSAIGRDSTMTEGLGAKDAPHAMSDEDRAQEQDPFRGMGELERRASLALGRREPDGGAAGRVRTANPVLEPRDRLHDRLGGRCRRVRDQVVDDNREPLWTGWRPALYVRLGTLDRSRRGRVPTDHPGGKEASIQGGRSMPTSARRREPQTTKHRPIDSRSSDQTTAERTLGRVWSLRPAVSGAGGTAARRSRCWRRCWRPGRVGRTLGRRRTAGCPRPRRKGTSSAGARRSGRAA